MHYKLTPISLSFPPGMGKVNCYLIQTDTDFILIDTGSSFNREALFKALADAGCAPGQLRLIVITHGDFDHTGNAAYLRKTFGGAILMHKDDLGMVEAGDMFFNRQNLRFPLHKLLPTLSGFGKAERFTPDLLVEDGYNLSAYGLDASVVSIPGHSKGSIGILTASGDLFCGDLMVSTNGPTLNSRMDDLAAANASLQKLASLGVETVYPGHGKPFPLSQVEAGKP
jgi:glyoxylase-like metal-dependent hydrolase (beta-lactamase superfamily II)